MFTFVMTAYMCAAPLVIAQELTTADWQRLFLATKECPQYNPKTPCVSLYIKLTEKIYFIDCGTEMGKEVKPEPKKVVKKSKKNKKSRK